MTKSRRITKAGQKRVAAKSRRLESESLFLGIQEEGTVPPLEGINANSKPISYGMYCGYYGIRSLKESSVIEYKEYLSLFEARMALVRKSDV